MADIASLYAAVKAAAELANYAFKANDALGQALTKHQIAQLVGALTDAQIQASEIKELLMAKDARIKELQEEIDLASQMIWREPVYYRATDIGEDGPYCQPCRDDKNKLIRLQSTNPGIWRCYGCGGTFFAKDYQAPNMSSDYDPLSNAGF